MIEEKDNNTIVISKNEYDKLIEDRKLLRALQTAGVDNWEGYETALDYLESNT